MLGRGAKLSMDGRGAWRDNVFAERKKSRLWGSVKYERVYLRAYESVSDAKSDIAEYIDCYNSQRGHTSLDNDQTPDAAYWQMLTNEKMAA